MTALRTKAFAPATVANVGPGFDVFGFALETVGDVVEANRTARGGVRLLEISGDGGRLPLGGQDNVVTVAAKAVLRAAKANFGVELKLQKGLPLGSGLGSSSASSVAAAVAVNALLRRPFSRETLIEFARLGEKAACGTAHADNVAPCLLGGFTIVRSYEPLEVVRLDVPSGWWVAVVHPHLELPTREARAVLPKLVPRAALVENVGNATAMVAALMKKDLSLFGRALSNDQVVEPARAPLIHGHTTVRRAALRAGAVGAAISGAGPSMFALASSRSAAEKIVAAMKRAWAREGVGADIIVSRMGAAGAKLIS